MVEGSSARLSKFISLTSKLAGVFFNEELEKSGIQLTLNQFIVLKKMSLEDQMCQSDLALITSRDKTSLTRLINTLEKKELVVRQEANNDKRKNLLALTKKGELVLNEAEPIMDKLENKITNNISAIEIEEVVKVLTKVQSNIIPTSKIKI